MAVDSVPQEFILMFDSAQGVEGAKAAVRDAISHWDSHGTASASGLGSDSTHWQGTLAPAIISTFTQEITGAATGTGPQAAAQGPSASGSDNDVPNDVPAAGPARPASESRPTSESESVSDGIAPFHGLLVRATPHLLGVLVEHHPDLLVIEPNAIVHTTGRQALNSTVTGRWSNWNLDVMDQVRLG